MVKKLYTEASKGRKGWAKDSIIIESVTQSYVCYNCKQWIRPGERAIKESGEFRHVDCKKKSKTQIAREEQKVRGEEMRKKRAEKLKGQGREEGSS